MCCLKHSATIYTCKMEIFPFPKIYPATPWCSCTLSCTSDCSAPVWKQPSCIHSVNVRGDMEFLPLCLGCKRRRQRDTRSRPFLLLLWDDFFIFFFIFLFLSCWLQKTSLDERRLCRAVGNPFPLSLSLSSICILRCSAEWSQRGAAAVPYRWMLSQY